MKRLFAILCVLVVLVGLTFPIVQVQPNVEASSQWVSRFSNDVDFGNGTHTLTSYIGPRAFWDNVSLSWKTLLFENHTDVENPYYLVHNAHITAKIGYSSKLDEFGVLYYDPDFTEKRAAEFWTVQAYVSDTWLSLTKVYYNHTVSQDNSCVNVTILFECKYGIRVGWFQIRYVVREGCFLKHEVAYRNTMTTTYQFRVVMTLMGVAGTKVIHALGEHTITFNETQIESNFLRFVNSTNPTFQFLQENLDSLGHYNENGTWINDYLKAIRLKLAEYDGKNLTRCDIVIGNFALAQGEELFIDPDSSSWSVSAATDDAELNDATSAHPPWDQLYTANSYSSLGQKTSLYYGTCTRFASVNIPNAATINSAYLSLKSTAVGYSSGSPVLRLCAEDTDDAATFSTVANYNARSRTGYVAWSPAAWAASTYYNSTDIASCIQTVVNRALWVSGQDVVVMCEDNGSGANAYRACLQYSDGPPILYVTWTSGETNKPTYSDISANTTNANWACLFSIILNDDTNVSVGIFSENITGPWTNTTVTLVWLNSTAAWANITKTHNSTVGILEGYMWYFNDTYNNWNSTAIQSLSTTFYAELNIVTATHSWSITPGQSNVTINENTINITVTANANFDVQAKSLNASLAFGSNTIALTNVLMHQSTLASAIALTTDYQDVPGLTNQASGNGLEKTFVMWLSAPVGLPVGNYTYTLSIQVIQA